MSVLQRESQNSLFVKNSFLLQKRTIRSLGRVLHFPSFNFEIELIFLRKTRAALFIFSNRGYFTNLRDSSDGVRTNLIKLCIPKIS